MATAATRKPKPSLGAQIDKMWDIREKKRNLETSIKDLDSQLATIEAELMADMEANGVDKMTGKHAGVSIRPIENSSRWARKSPARKPSPRSASTSVPCNRVRSSLKDNHGNNQSPC